MLFPINVPEQIEELFVGFQSIMRESSLVYNGQKRLTWPGDDEPLDVDQVFLYPQEQKWAYFYRRPDKFSSVYGVVNPGSDFQEQNILTVLAEINFSPEGDYVESGNFCLGSPGSDLVSITHSGNFRINWSKEDKTTIETLAKDYKNNPNKYDVFPPEQRLYLKHYPSVMNAFLEYHSDIERLAHGDRRVIVIGTLDNVVSDLPLDVLKFVCIVINFKFKVRSLIE
jgi:hypothetical protein